MSGVIPDGPCVNCGRNPFDCDCKTAERTEPVKGSSATSRCPAVTDERDPQVPARSAVKVLDDAIQCSINNHYYWLGHYELAKKAGASTGRYAGQSDTWDEVTLMLKRIKSEIENLSNLASDGDTARDR